MGLEPTKVLPLTAFQEQLLIQPDIFQIAVMEGFEPSTLVLTAPCSTFELHDMARVRDLFRLLPGATPFRTFFEETAIPYAYIFLVAY
jgi:hypothetical protein